MTISYKISLHGHYTSVQTCRTGVICITHIMYNLYRTMCIYIYFNIYITCMVAARQPCRLCDSLVWLFVLYSVNIIVVFLYMHFIIRCIHEKIINVHVVKHLIVIMLYMLDWLFTLALWSSIIYNGAHVHKDTCTYIHTSVNKTHCTTEY